MNLMYVFWPFRSGFFFSPFIDSLADGGWRATHTPPGGRKKKDTLHTGKPNNTFHTGNKINSKGVSKGKEQFSRCSWTFELHLVLKYY